MAAYLICYQRCDPMYETTPHIHTPDGIFTVGEELDAIGKNAIILNDLPSIARVNGDLIVLQQTCGNCHTCFVGSCNFHYCPNCREVLIHIEYPELPNPDARQALCSKPLPEDLHCNLPAEHYGACKNWPSK
jgi:hypothetical protein